MFWLSAIARAERGPRGRAVAKQAGGTLWISQQSVDRGRGTFVLPASYRFQCHCKRLCADQAWGKGSTVPRDLPRVRKARFPPAVANRLLSKCSLRSD